MFIFAENTRSYRRIGLALLLWQLNCFIFCMPPFQAGIWVQTEPTICALYVFAALTALWLAVGINRRLLMMPYALSPLLACLLAWIALQLLMTYMAVLPVRSWFGPPQTGEGTGISVAILLMALLAYPLWRIPMLQRVILAVCAISFSVQCGLHFYYPEISGNPYIPDRWIPAQWPEYLPFIAGYLWVAVFTAGLIRNKGTYLLMVIAMAIVLVDSMNKSAFGFFTAALLVTTCLYCLPLSKRFFMPNTPWRIAAMVACVLPFAIVIFSNSIPVGNAPDQSAVRKIFYQINDGFGTRVLLDRVGMSVFQHEPNRLLQGNGWGTFSDDLFKYALVKDVSVYTGVERVPNWFLVDGSSHHSHNQPLEALLSLGIAGLILWYAFPMLALWALPKEHFWTCGPMIVALTGLGHFWFQLPQCFAYQALYIAALFSACGGVISLPVTSEKHFAWLVSCMAGFVAMAWSANDQYQSMMHADEVHVAITTGQSKDHTEEWLGEDLSHGGDRWGTSARFYATDASNKAAQHDINENMLGWYSYFLHNADRASADNKIGPHTTFVELRMQYYLFGGFYSPLFDRLRHQATVSFENAVLRLTRKAPLREDQISFFLINLPGFTHNDALREVQILNHILALSPHHRSALWLLGHMYLNTPGKEVLARNMLKEAIANHVEIVYPVSDAELTANAQQLGLP